MDQAHPLSTPMIGKNCMHDDPYRLYEEEEEEEVIHKTYYLTLVGAFIYLATYTRHDSAFATSILTTHSQKPTMRHWKGVKHLMRYLRGTEDSGLHLRKIDVSKIIGYVY